MTIRTPLLLFVGACLLTMTQSLFGQNAAGTHSVRRYFDPQTRTLIALPQVDNASAEAPALMTFTGTFVFNFTINVKANISSTAKIQCTATATVLDLGSGNDIIESNTVLATRSGTTATCSPTIPYSWNLASSTSDKVSLGWTLSAPGQATSTAVVPARLSEQFSFASFAVPANGTTTTETLTPTF